MIGIFVDQHLGQQAGTGSATLDRAAWQRGLREAIAARAGHPGPHDPVHDEASGHIFQLLGHIFAQPAQFAATLDTGRVAGGQLDLHAWNMVRDRLALWFVGWCIIGQAKLCGQSGDGDLTHLQSQLELLGCLG